MGAHRNHARRGFINSFKASYRQAARRPNRRTRLTLDQQYHINKHRGHAAKMAWYKILGVAVLVVLILCCAGVIF